MVDAGEPKQITNHPLKRLFVLSAAAVLLFVLEVAALELSSRCYSLTDSSIVQKGALPFYGLIWLFSVGLMFVFFRGATIPWLPKPSCFTKLNAVVLCLVLGQLVYNFVIQHAGCVATFPHLVTFLSGAVVVVIVEEFIFRGALWSVFEQTGFQRYNVVFNILFTSTLFALWHLPFPQHSSIVAHGIFGAGMGVVRWRFNSLMFPAILHGLHNGAFLLCSS